jgi:hypothetical protein
MFRVRDEQLEVLERRLFEVMHRRIEQAVAATFPEFRNPTRSRGANEPAVEERASLEAVVARGIESAVKFDIGDGADIAAFIALGLALRLAPPGECGAWIHSCLNRPGTSGPTKLRMIESRLRPLAAGNGGLGLIAQRVAKARDRMAE